MTSTETPARWTEYMRVRDLPEADRNAKSHDDALIDDSLERFGYIEAIVLDERTGQLVAGHGRRGRLIAGEDADETPPDGIESRDDGWYAPVLRGWASEDDREAEAAGMALNKIGERGGWDTATLVDMLADQNDFTGIGWSQDDLDGMINESLSGLDPDEVPPEPEDPVSQPGDVWILGEHRLVCGDSTDPKAFKALLGDEKVNMVWTDPPYGVNYVGKTKSAMTIENDDLDLAGLTAFLQAAFEPTLRASKKGACWFVASPSGPQMKAFIDVLMEMGIYRQLIVWVKDVFVLGRSDYHGRHEVLFVGSTEGDVVRYPYEEGHENLLYGWAPGAGHKAPPNRRQDSVWEVPRPKSSREHPTMKPIELVERALINHSRPGEVVLDPFGGSGTTLLAAEGSRRRARLIEKAPGYCDVICTRYQALTDVVPVLESSGEAHNFLAGTT